MDIIKEEIEDYLTKRKFLNLATSSKEGKPLSHPIAYINIGPDVYFATRKSRRKAKNIAENPNVAYSVYDPTDHFDEIKLIQMEGIATEITDKTKFKDILQKISEKFPFSKNIVIDKDTIIVKITPKFCYYCDNIKRLGETKEVEF
jgi:general stress protein 26